jgi:ABC-type sugar transport system permease subunit
MTRAIDDVSFQSCPACGSALARGALTCGYCGGVVAVENVTRRLKFEFRGLLAQAGQRLQDRTVLMWVLALVPVLVLPPVLALLMILRPSSNEAGESSRNFNVSMLLVALCNIVLSVLFWRWLSEVSLSSGLSPGLFLKSIGISHPRSSWGSI